MAFIAECPFCSLKLRGVPDELAGGSAECPLCHCQFTLAAMLHPPKELVVIPRPNHPGPKHHEQSQTVQSAIAECAQALAPEPASEEKPARTRPRRKPNLRGITALALASLALMVASLPYLAVLTTLLVGLSLAFAFLGFVTKDPRSSILSPSASLGVSSAVLLAVLFRPDWFRPETRWWHGLTGAGKETVVAIGKRGAGSRKVDEQSGWVDAGKEAAQLNGVRVRVVSATVQPVEAKTPPDKKPQQELVVKLRLNNVGAGKAIPYMAWSKTSQDQEAILSLKDDVGEKIGVSSFFLDPNKAGEPGNEGVRKNEPTPFILQPGKFVEDVLVFNAPSRAVEFLRLELAAAAFGEKGKLQLQIPKEMIVYR